MLLSLLLHGAILFLPHVVAKSWTDCNPMNDNCPNNPALGTSYDFTLNNSSIVNKFFNVTSGYIRYGNKSAGFAVSKRGDSPTLQSKFYVMFGTVSVFMRAASGQGIISSIVLQSDDLDEIDWNFFGGNGTHIESNYCGKGNTTSVDRATYHSVSFDPRENFHNYSIHWTSDKLEWWIDSKLVRTLSYSAANGGYNYPQTPMTIRLGIWAGGDKKNSPSTIEWAGGLSNFSKDPYIMEAQNTEIRDFGSGSAYQWTDQSGSWESIGTIPGNSTAFKAIRKLQEPPTPSLMERFLALPSTTKLAVYCSLGAAFFLLFSALTFVCYKSRRKGRRERDAYEARLDKERQEASQDSEAFYQKNPVGWDTSSSQRLSYEKTSPVENHSPNEILQTLPSDVIDEVNTYNRPPPPIPKDDTSGTSIKQRSPNSNTDNPERTYVLRNKSFSSRNPAFYSTSRVEG
ncbi:hypothetical protein HI914_01041 [Erysiphe necator]|nr:hypothetical protein HI914_01041 [Erysiphe necator]